MAIGTFEWLEDLKVDDEVELVVSETEDGPLFINAILRKNDRLLWMPYSTATTRFGWAMDGIKISALCIGGTWLMFMVYFCVRSDPFPTRQHLIWLHIGLLLLMAFLVFMSKNSMATLGKQAEDIYCALGVPRYQRFEISDFSLRKLDFMNISDPLKKSYIFKFDEALKSHKKKYRLT
ncbi:hypothetical protein BN2497_2161 [Janthinobacterium sp. CG23_2]|nr:hypothetical protein BN2497_2161 [Janthinobacterium sp. CG23_2]CUU27478.1 hypothetical protein BN3177_2161 [Janthinobacterium sp. CG23_2]